MSFLSFESTGDPDKDQEIADNFMLHEKRMKLNVCPNGCAQMNWIDAHNRECPTCGFAGFSTVPYDMTTARA